MSFELFMVLTLSFSLELTNPSVPLRTCAAVRNSRSSIPLDGCSVGNFGEPVQTWISYRISLQIVDIRARVVEGGVFVAFNASS
jgi:hypothetical protein